MKKFLVWILCLLCASLFGETTMRTLYPEIEPHRTGMLPVGNNHTLYWEECGNPAGKPVVFLHGGPGGGLVSYHRSFFDPTRYRIILFDQRGCGKSLPFSSLENNTTWDLVEDVEHLRKHLGIDHWIVFGGSWGSTLGLTYAIKHPESVKGLILRGVFLCRQKEIQWFYQSGANYLFPDLWEHYCKPIPLEERGDFLQAYYKRLTSNDLAIRKEAARAWSAWEGGTGKLRFDPELVAGFTEDDSADSMARIECHYFTHNTFFPTDNWILENIDVVRSIPCIIVQGRYDVVCPILSAWELHRAWPEARLEIIPDAGHSATEPGIVDALIRATDFFAE